MHDDEPADEVHDLFAETLFGDTPLGRLGLGTVESIEALTRDDVDGFYRAPVRHALDRRRPPPAASTTQQVLDLVTRGVRRTGSTGDAAPGAAAARRPARRRGPARPAGLITRRTEQAHLLLGAPGDGPARRAPLRRSPCSTTRVGGGMSSPAVPGDPGEARPGLLASARALSHYADAGTFAVYAGCSPRSACPRCCG